MSALLRLEKIKARYPNSKKDVLQDISIVINKGDFITLLGPNGAGKSTLFKAIYGTLHFYTGKIFYKNKILKKISPELWKKKDVNYQPQGGRIFYDLSIEDNFLLANRYSKKSQIKKGISEFFSFLDEIPDGKLIIENYKKRTGNLSGGQRQIVLLGMVLIGKPKFLLLDEPTAGLAPKISEKILSWLKQKNINEGLTIFIVEHNLKSLLTLSNRMINMNYGKIYEMKKEDFSNINLLRKKILQTT